MRINIVCAALRQCGSAAVRAAVRHSAHGSVRAVRAVGCGSALGSVWECARQCAALRQCGSVRQCAAVCGSVRQCGSAAVRVWQCAVVRQCMVVRAAAVCGM